MDKIATKSDSFTPEIKPFLNENNFRGFSQDHRRALYSYFSKNHKILIINLGQQIYFKFSMYTPYPLLSQLYKFHIDWISSLGIPTFLSLKI